MSETPHLTLALNSNTNHKICSCWSYVPFKNQHCKFESVKDQWTKHCVDTGHGLMLKMLENKSQKKVNMFHSNNLKFPKKIQKRQGNKWQEPPPSPTLTLRGNHFQIKRKHYLLSSPPTTSYSDCASLQKLEAPLLLHLPPPPSPSSLYLHLRSDSSNGGNTPIMPAPCTLLQTIVEVRKI